jgi:hypothetical protein
MPQLPPFLKGLLKGFKHSGTFICLFVVFTVLGLELRAYTLSNFTSPFL